MESDRDDLATLHLLEINLRFCDVVVDLLLAGCEEVREDDVEIVPALGLLLLPKENDVFVELDNLVAVLLVVEADAIERVQVVHAFILNRKVFVAGSLLSYL